MKEIPQSLPKKEWKKNYENNKTKYQERKRRPDAHATRRAESNGSQLEAVWACDWCTSWQAERNRPNNLQAKNYEVVKNKLTQTIYYSEDEETGEIGLDLYSMEEEALEQLKEANPGKKVTSVYSS